MIKFMKQRLLLSDKSAKYMIKSTLYYSLIQLFTIGIASLYYFALQEFIKPLSGGNIVMSTLYMILGLGAGYAIMLFIFNYLHYAIYNIVYEQSAIMRLEIGDRLRKLPMSYYNKANIADMATILLRDVTDLEEGSSHVYSQFAGTVIASSLVTIMIFAYEWRVALAIFWVVPVTAAVYILSAKAVKKGMVEINKRNIITTNFLQENLDMISEIKSYEVEQKIGDEIDIIAKDNLQCSVKNELKGSAILYSCQTLLNLGVVSSLVISTILYTNGQIDFLKFLMVMLLTLNIFAPYEGLMRISVLFIYTEVKIKRVKGVMDAKIQEGSDCPKLTNYDIEFKNVDFSYEDKKQTIKNVSFVAEQNTVTALIGQSGGGKSTIAKLATRFWDIDKGEISLGGYDISKINPESLLKNYSMVFQDVTLFNMSVFENIKIGKADATDEEVYAAAKMANCDEFVEKLNDGYNTLIGENGSRLSGGERQRISIARAFLKDAPVIILDEATASLDVENETTIQESLNVLLQNKTVIIIAHRMRTVSNADKIVVLENGKIKEMGSPKELRSKKDSYFNKMMKYQEEAKSWKIV